MLAGTLARQDGAKVLLIKKWEAWFVVFLPI
jgi:hypothetical protein